MKLLGNVRQRISDFQAHVNSVASDVRSKAQDSWNGINFGKSEPEIIYDFLAGTTNGTGFLNRNIAPLLSGNGRTVKFASVFLHQKPLVLGSKHSSKHARPGASPCELGDLQLLFLYVDSSKSICQCRSVIFQAKKAPEGGGVIIKNRHQWLLYDESHSFEYKTVLPGTVRVLPKNWNDRERALQYLFMGQQPVRTRLIPAISGAGAFVEFGEFFLRLLNDSTGLDVAPVPTRANNWTRIIWDLIENVAESTAGKRKTRNSGLYGLLQHFNSFENREDFFLEGPPPGEGSNDINAPGGIPLLMAILSDEELGSLAPIKSLQNSTLFSKNPSAPGLPVSDSSIHVKSEMKLPSATNQVLQELPLRPLLESAQTSDLLSHLDSCQEHDEFVAILREISRRQQCGMLHGLTARDAETILKILLTEGLEADFVELRSDLKNITKTSQQINLELPD